jgi:DNA-binding protein H-NS
MHTFQLLRLLKSELHQLELLRRLEVKLKVATPEEKEHVQQEVDRAMEEIARLSKSIQALKANPSLATLSGS